MLTFIFQPLKEKSDPRVCVDPFCRLSGDFYDISKGRRQHDEDNIKVIRASLQKELEAINNSTQDKTHTQPRTYQNVNVAHESNNTFGVVIILEGPLYPGEGLHLRTLWVGVLM